MSQLQKPDANVKKDIRSLIQSDHVKSQLALVLPKHLTPERMTRVALTAILKTPKLLECSPESLLQALMLCSQAGLEPDGRNAHLIPYGNQVQVIFDYRGLITLAERNGVKNIRAVVVCDKDDFEFSIENGAPKLHHVINWREDRGKAYAYYGTCIRNEQFDVEVMTKAEVDAIRKRSKASGSGPWVTDYDEMAKKTVIRRMSKRWDLSAEVAEAVNADSDTPAPIVNAPDGPTFAPNLPPPIEATTNDDGDLAPAIEAKTEPVVEAAPETAEVPITMIEKLISLGLNEKQVIAFWNSQPSKSKVSTLSEIPADKLLQLTTNPAHIENIKKVKVEG